MAGTTCLECEEGQVVPSRPTERRKKKTGATGGISIAYAGGAVGLLPYLVVRFALVAAAAAGALLAARRAGLEALEPVTSRFDPGPSLDLPVLIGGIVVASLLVGIVNTLIRGHRMRHTFIYGERVAYRPAIFGLAGNLILNVIFMAVTVGLALPWIYARNRRSFYRNCVVPGHADRALAFEPSGDEMLGYSFLSLLLAPLVVVSVGLLRPLVSWMWLRWEQSHLVIPGKFGQMERVRFTGTFGGYLVRSILWWVLAVGTAGIGRAWTLTLEWKWIARHSAV